MSDVQKIPIDAVRLDFQPRENLSPETIGEYVMALQRGEELRAVRVRFDGTSYFLEDGFHRIEAARQVGITEIDAEVVPGTLADMEAEFEDYLRALLASLRPQPSNQK
jgi:hypothetical protein